MISYLFLYIIITFILCSRLKKEWINVICGTIIFIFMGFRYDVGWDFRWYFELATQNYLVKESIFSNLKNLVEFEPNLFQYLRLEFFNKVIYQIVWYLNSPQLLILIYSFLLIFFIVKGLKNEKKYSSYSWLSFIAFPLFLFNFMSLVRQSIAVAIVFYSYKYIKRRNFIKFLMCIIVASLFHKTALFAVIIYFIPLINISYSYLVMIMLSSFFSLNILKIILKLPLFSAYAVYVNQAIGEGGKIIYYLIILLVGMYLLFYKKLLKLKESNRGLINIIMLGAYLYISLIKLGHLGPRMSQYFLIFILYTLDDILILFKQKKEVKIIFIGINLVFILLILYGDYNNKIRSQYIPYQINFFNRGVEWK